MKLNKVWHLLRKEAILEFRNIYTLAGILLFASAVVFLIYKSFNALSGLSWIVMLFLSLLFSGINAVAKSFRAADDASRLFEYTLFAPEELILSKLIYNFLFLALIFGLVCLGFSVFLGFVIKDMSLFFIGIIGGLLGLSIIFTFLSSVSNQSGQRSSVLLSVMALPMTLPILLLLIKITTVAARLIQDTSVSSDIIMLLGIDLLLLGLVFLLFKELWKD